MIVEYLFGTAVDERTLLVRQAPESGLRVLPFENQSQAHVIVALPESWPALTPQEARAIRAYFTWSDTGAFWWRTQRPAVVSLEQITSDIWAAHLVEAGVILPAGDDPAHAPRGHTNTFKVWKVPDTGRIVDPWGPTIHHRDGRPIEALRSATTRTIEGSFPAFSADVVWLKLFLPNAESSARRSALRSEAAGLLALYDRRPDLVVEVLHHGELDSAGYRGGYLAVRKPFGVGLPTFLATLEPGEPKRRAAIDICRGIAQLAALAHLDGNCLGPLTASLIGVRLGLVTKRLGAKVQLRGAPGAGPQGSQYDTDVFALLPSHDTWTGLHRTSRPAERNARIDLATVGDLYECILDACDVSDRGFRGLTKALLAGELKDAAELLLNFD
jgi:hypothetical protein